jgi:hypothetical protein
MKPVYRIAIQVPSNGRARTAHVVVFRENGEAEAFLFDDCAKMNDMRERRKLVKRMTEKIPGADAEAIEKQLQEAWAELQNRQLRERKEREEAAAARRQAEGVSAGIYGIGRGGIFRWKYTRDGDPVQEPLANFRARIVEEIVCDDGAEVRILFRIDGSLADGRPLPRAEVAAAEFGGMGWVLPNWGSRAVVNAGQGARDHLRAAIQNLSGEPPRRTVYAHTGWRNIGGQMSYLHAGGAIGANGPIPGTETALPDKLNSLLLPPPVKGAPLRDAIRASLRLLDLGPDRLTFPCLAAPYRAVLGGVDFAIHLAGQSGAFKTEVAALVQQHFGAGFHARNLPGSWSSTANATELLLFHAKDALLVVDDFAPAGDQSNVARTHREADRLLRASGNRAARQRMTADGKLRPEKPPRGLILSTGEDIPKGHSIRARTCVMEVSKGDIDPARLTHCQRDAAAGLYAQAMAGFIRWLAPRVEELQAGLRQRVERLRERYASEQSHRRTPGLLADLSLGFQLFVEFAQDVGAVTAGQAENLLRRLGAAVEEVGQAQAAHHEAAEPTAHFLRLLRGVVSSGRAHLAASDGSGPADVPQAWGWRREEVPVHDGVNFRWWPQGRRIGWIQGGNVYLEPEAVYAEAQKLGSEQGESIAISQRVLSKRLHERQLLVTTEHARGKLTVRHTLEGKRRDVWHLSAQTVFPTPDTGPIGPSGPEVGELP